MLIRSDYVAYAASLMVAALSALTFGLTYAFQSRWRNIKTVPFLSDATYDENQAPIFSAGCTLAGISILLVALLTYATVSTRRVTSVGGPRKLWLARTGLAFGTAGALCLVLASIVSARFDVAHWTLASITLCTFLTCSCSGRQKNVCLSFISCHVNEYLLIVEANAPAPQFPCSFGR